MKVIIAGSRWITNYEEVLAAMDYFQWIYDPKPISSIISGTDIGVDALGEEYAADHGIPVLRVHPEREDFNESELDHLLFTSDHPEREDSISEMEWKEVNHQMAELGDALVAVWDGHSVGTHDMIQRAIAGGLIVYIHTVKKES